MPAAKSTQELHKLTAAEPKNAPAWHALGNALLDEGKFDRGISAFRRALRIDDSLAEVHNDLGSAYFDKGWHQEAEACFRKAVALRPDHGIAHANLGAALRAQSKLGDSRRAFQRALLMKIRGLLPRVLRWRIDAGVGAAPSVERPSAAEVKQVADAVNTGRLKEALELAQQLERRYAADADTLHLHAVALEQNRQYDDALAKVGAAIALKGERAEYYMARARILVRAMRHDEALEAAAQALRLEPGSALVLAMLSAIYHPWRDDLAAEAAQKAVDIDPTSDLAHGNLASALWGLGRLEEAEKHAREAVRLNPKQLSFRANLALVLKDLGRIDEARELYRRMIEEAPDYPKICMDMGTLAVECEGDLESAKRWYRKAQEASDNPRAALSEAIANLLGGNFADGWEQYEARKGVPDQHYQQAPFAGFRPWNGEKLGRERLLLYGEQGLGDEIMYASMYREVAQRAPNVTLMCDERLGALFRRSFPEFEIVGEPREKFAASVPALQGVDFALAAGSLGRYFRRHAGDFPARRGYLAVDPAKVSAWRPRLGATGAGLKVGLSWIGGVQRTGRSRRSLTLEQLQPLLEIGGVQWISLQYTDAATELAELRAKRGLMLHQFDGVTNDMDELASLIGALDLVISVCNTTVHVAGAIGKEVLVMAPFVPEWRYGMSGERMIWYPSAHVFRQATYGNWDGVIARAAEELKARLAAGAAAHVVDQ
jgi:tetratricopeptide (TPR) repeat protein